MEVLMATDAVAMPASAPFPVRFDVDYPESMSRLTFLKWIMVIPHLIILWLLNYVWELLSFIAAIAILFTTKYPEGLFSFNYGIMRWQANVTAYWELMRDEYPPFSFDAQYPVHLQIDTPDTLNRWAPLYKWLLAIPHFLIVGVLGFVAFFVVIYAGIMVLVSGKYPEGAFKFVVGVQRWSVRVTTYAFFMHDQYPPFTMD
jgi:hypothetical protein